MTVVHSEHGVMRREQSELNFVVVITSKMSNIVSSMDVVLFLEQWTLARSLRHDVRGITITWSAISRRI